jgi:hypothetical protein
MIHNFNHTIKGNKKMNKKEKKTRNRRTRYENKHKLLTQDVQTQDVTNNTIQTVVPAITGKTHEGKVVPSPKIKHQSKDADLLHIAVQNCNGLRKEAYKCRLANTMDAENIDICCLTETHLPTIQSERWDTGHTVLTSGMIQPLRGRGTQGVGVCLSQKAVLWYEAAGSRFVPINSRFATFRLLIGTTTFYFIVWHAPTSAATPAIRQSNLDLLSDLTDKCGANETLIIMTEANAAIGPSSDQDRVCGPHSSPHENIPGTHLRTMLAMHGLYAPVTYYPQKILGSWIHPHYNGLYQCDHAFLKWDDRRVVKKVWNAAMLTHSDHCSLRLDVLIRKWKKPPSTLREKKSKLDFPSLFHPSKISTTPDLVLSAMINRPTQMQSLMDAVDLTISTLPKTVSIQSGWYDVNNPVTRPLVLSRNAAHELWTTTGTATAKAAYRASDKTLQVALRQAENSWWQQELAPAQSPHLPGGAARRTPYAFWQQAQHALRGSSKWKPRSRAFVRNISGVQAVTVAENVDKICDYFSSIYNFSSRPAAAAHIMRMPQIEPDRSYLSPRTHEVQTAVRALKHKAPGLSGTPISVWKTLLTNADILQIVTAFL